MKRKFLFAPTDGNGGGVQTVSNNFGTNNTLDFTVTADNAGGTAALNTVYILAGRGDTAYQSLPSGVTVSGDYDDWANLRDYLNNIPMTITQIQLKTDDTDNFGYRIETGNMNPNRQNEKISRIDLTKYRQPTGNGYADSLTIADQAIAAIPQTFLSLQLLKNTYIRVTLTIAQLQLTAQVSPANF